MTSQTDSIADGWTDNTVARHAATAIQGLLYAILGGLILSVTGIILILPLYYGFALPETMFGLGNPGSDEASIFQVLGLVIGAIFDIGFAATLFVFIDNWAD